MDFLEQKLGIYQRPSEPEHSPDYESEEAFREEHLTSLEHLANIVSELRGLIRQTIDR